MTHNERRDALVAAYFSASRRLREAPALEEPAPVATVGTATVANPMKAQPPRERGWWEQGWYLWQTNDKPAPYRDTRDDDGPLITRRVSEE